MTSVIIVNWNSGHLLRMCVQSLIRHAQGCEIIVVDNASEDGSAEFIASLGSAVRVLKNATNLGFAAGNNMGWISSHGEQVLFLNPDTECLPDSIGRLVDMLDSNNTAWAVGGLLLDPAGEIQTGFNVRSFPTPGSVAAEMLLLDEIWPGNPWTRRYRMSDWDHRSPREVDQPAAACLLVRRRVLESLGGFDESFSPAWFEDVDLCRRIRNSGGRILFQPAARFLHHGGSSLSRLAPQEFLKHYHVNQIRYFAKHHGSRAALWIRRLITAGMCLRAGASLLCPPVWSSSRFSSARIYWSTARLIAAMPEVAA